MPSIAPGSSSGSPAPAGKQGNLLNKFNKGARGFGWLLKTTAKIGLVGLVGYDFAMACTYTSGPANIALNTVERLGVQVNNVAQIPIRYFTRDEDALVSFRQNTWPTHALICQKKDGAALTDGQKLEREEHFTEMERRLRQQVDNNSGEIYNKIRNAIERREHPVVFLPLPGSNTIEIVSYPNREHQTCSTQPGKWNGDNRSTIPVSRFDP
jgi:hypothetical protein